MDEGDARKYQELAVKTMEASVPEPRDDGKATPKVAAVLVMPDGEVFAASRGELRDGEHAEFTLLERKCANLNLAGSTLFVTLEPCADGARKFPKSACAKRIVAARIKQVWVGREDPYPTVATKGLTYLQNNGVEVNLFDADLQEAISLANAEFIAQAEEAAETYEEETEEEPVLSPLDDAARASLADLSETALAAYKEQLGIETDDQLRRTLIGEGLLVEEDGELRPTGFCTLLFGRDPRSRFSQAGVLGTITYPGGGEETKDFEGPLIEIPREVESWLKDKLPNLLNTDQMKSTRGENLPLDAIREGLINALIHRDYGIEGAKVQLRVTKDGYAIESPGQPDKPMTVEKLASLTASTLSQNPKLHYVFKQMDLAEERNRGMKTLRELQADGDVVPTYTFDDPYLTLTLHTNPESAASEIASAEIVEQLTADEIEGWAFLRRRGVVSTSDYMNDRGVSERTARRHLNKLVTVGLATREGRGPATRFSSVPAADD